MLKQNSNRLFFVKIACLFLPAAALPMTAMADPFELAAKGPRDGRRDLQLEVFVNGKSSGYIAAFTESADGRLGIRPEQLTNCGLDSTAGAFGPDGLVDIGSLPGVAFVYDEALQTVTFTADPEALATRRISAVPVETQTDESAAVTSASSLGALVNYTLFASSYTEGDDDPWSFSGLSGSFEGRVFGEAGVITSSEVVTLSPNEHYSTARLDTAWNYADEGRMLNYTAGDLITGGLSWTRPVRLGGLQVQRNFGLKPDLVTMPMPKLSGSAAVPSTVEVYLDNTRSLSRDVEAGPFSVSDIPVVTGNSTARLVVRDALGRETVSETALYASSALLASGLFDYSAEAGYARRGYGVQSFSYDDRLMATATGRYGLTDWMTVDGHAEAGGGFWNAGVGSTVGLGWLGLATLSGAASSYARPGYFAAASIETEIWGLQWHASSQRSFGDYHDIASVTAETASGRSYRKSAAPPRVFDQIGLSLPLGFDSTVLNLNFTHVETVAGEKSRIFGATASRTIGTRGNAFVTAFADVSRDDVYGMFAGMSWTFGEANFASVGVQHDADGTSFVTEAAGRQEWVGVGAEWRMRDSEGARRGRGASLALSGTSGRVAARVEQSGKAINASAEAEGALVFAGGQVFVSERVEDSFAVIDVGDANIGIEVENRPAGRTNKSGKLLVTGLRAYEQNKLGLDPDTIPAEASAEALSRTVTPKQKSGVVVKIAVKRADQPLILTLRDGQGVVLDAGSVITVDGSEEAFVVGYDGQAYVTGLSGHRQFTVETPGKAGCGFELTVEPANKERKLLEVTCRSDA